MRLFVVEVSVCWLCLKQFSFGKLFHHYGSDDGIFSTWMQFKAIIRYSSCLGISTLIRNWTFQTAEWFEFLAIFSMDKTSLYRSFVANDNLIANYLAKKAAVILAKIISSKGKINRLVIPTSKTFPTKWLSMTTNKQTSINDQWTQFQTRKFQIILNTT